MSKKEDAVIAVSDSAEDGLDSAHEGSCVANPFEVVERSEFENLEYALQVLEDMTARMNTSNSEFKQMQQIYRVLKRNADFFRE